MEHVYDQRRYAWQQPAHVGQSRAPGTLRAKPSQDLGTDLQKQQPGQQWLWPGREEEHLVGQCMGAGSPVFAPIPLAWAPTLTPGTVKTISCKSQVNKRIYLDIAIKYIMELFKPFKECGSSAFETAVTCNTAKQIPKGLEK